LEENLNLSAAQREFIQALFATGGEVFKADSCDARQLPTASAISGCGPAFVAQFAKDCLDTHAESIEGIDATLSRFLAQARLGVDICKNADDTTLISLSVFRAEVLESGVLHGFTFEQSHQLFLGAIDGYLSIRSHGATPEQVIRKVATPGGTTEAALKYANDVNQDLSHKPWSSVISLAAARMGSPFPYIQKK
jgi:pyrroline-5-carboxylate reductase